ncbi:MAG TPA: hypothetical protein VE224_18880, partial [Pseudolabrys sp.]|nr:hypothetical protein [Pseudolabrys sp.]
ARCKATWFAGGQQDQVDAFVDEVTAEAETAEPEPFLRAAAGAPPPPPTVDDFGGSDAEEAAPGAMPTPAPDKTFSASDDAPPARHAEAEPETITDAPPLVPPMDEAAAEPEGDDVETYAARRLRLKSRRKQAKRSSRWTVAVLVLLAINVALIGGRREVVSYLPQTASLFSAIGLPVNLRQLKFENVKIEPSTTGGEGLTVRGTIVSTGHDTVKVPLLRFAARNAAGQEIYVWTKKPGRDMLGPGDRLDFESALAAPPVDAKDVLVRFATAQEAADLAARNGAPDAMARPGQPGGDH